MALYVSIVCIKVFTYVVCIDVQPATIARPAIRSAKRSADKVVSLRVGKKRMVHRKEMMVAEVEESG